MTIATTEQTYMLSANPAAVTVKMPVSPDAVLPTSDTPPRNTSTVDPASAVMVSVGLTSLVISSLLLDPLSTDSEPITGAAGSAVAIKTGKLADASLELPAVSVATSVNTMLPSDRLA